MDNVYKKLQQAYDNAPTEREKIDLLVEMTLEVRNSDAEKALEMANDIINRAKAIGYEAGIGEGLNHKGACYWLMGEYEDGLEELAQAMKIATAIKAKGLEAKVLNNFGRIYRNMGDLAHALMHFESALEINETLGNELNQTINLTNISNLYYDLGDYDTALEYALKCLPIFEKNAYSSRLFAIYNTLGDIYFKMTDFDRALFYFKKTLETTADGSLNRAIANSGMGKVYFKLGAYEKAGDYLDRSLAQAKALNIPEAEIIAEFYKGKLLYKQGNFAEALKNVEYANEMASDTLRRHDLISIHEFLADLYERMDNVPQAYFHLKAYEKMKEEVFQQATLNKLRNLQLKNQMVVAQKEKEVAQKTARLKHQFMANMSHEIRTPMNAIVGITRLLIEKDPRPDQLKYLEAIRKSSDNLLVIINDILDLSKIEAGKIQLEQIEFSFRELLHSMYEIMAIRAEEKNLKFHLTIKPDIPDRMLGDPSRLNQILINLVGNAIKFTEQGHVKVITALTAPQEGKKIRVSFDISDTGIGISEEYVETIFESFTQAGTDTARKYGGTGLGLTISKQLTELMSGNITVRSKLGEGTTFRVEVPLEIAEVQHVQQKKPEVTEAIRSRLEKARILLVEDNEFNLLVAEDTLKSALPSVQLDTADNGEEAIRKLREKDFDIILMDIQMPVMNGVEATHYIRNTLPENKRHIKIIAMTANVLQEDVQRYLKAGMNAYISKPFQTEELLLKMNMVLEGDNMDLPARPAVSAKPAEFAELPDQVIDMTFLTRFSEGNTKKQEKYIRMFLANAPKLLEQIDQAIQTANYQQLKVAAHSMKPQLSYMGVSEKVSNIQLIEQISQEEAHQAQLPALVEQLNKVCSKAFTELNAVLNSKTL